MGLKQEIPVSIKGEGKMYRIITNNQMCLVKYGDQIQVEYLDGQSYMDVLVKVRIISRMAGVWKRIR